MIVMLPWDVSSLGNLALSTRSVEALIYPQQTRPEVANEADMTTASEQRRLKRSRSTRGN